MWPGPRPTAGVMKVISLLALLGVLGLGNTGRADAAGLQLGSCDDEPPPCIAAVERDGVDVSSSPNYSAIFYFEEFGGESSIHGGIQDSSYSGYGLGPDSLEEIWSVAVETGPVLPVQVYGRAGQVLVDRERLAGDNYLVTVTGRPVIFSPGCDWSVWPPSCPSVAEYTNFGHWDFYIGDFGHDSTDPRPPEFGYSGFSNIDVNPTVPDVRANPDGTHTFSFLMGNSHFQQDGATPVAGEFGLVIPRSYFRFIGDLESVRLSSAEVEMSGPGSGTIRATNHFSNEFLTITGEDISFSTRKLRITLGGWLRRPTRVRVSAGGRGKLEIRFREPEGRGIQHFRALCLRRGDRARGRARHSPILVAGLRRRKPYTCTVRAVAATGVGPASKPASGRAG